jgi:hypothetical protein
MGGVGVANDVSVLEALQPSSPDRWSSQYAGRARSLVELVETLASR